MLHGLFLRARSNATLRQMTVMNPCKVYFSSKPLELGKGRAKTSTGFTGLEVDHDAVSKIVSKSQAVLDLMAASDMPETYQYRINVEKILRYRIKVCLENPDDPEKVEELCNCGQVEELVVQSENEMKVLNMMLENRFWEKIVHFPEFSMEDVAPLVGEAKDSASDSDSTKS